MVGWKAQAAAQMRARAGETASNFHSRCVFGASSVCLRCRYTSGNGELSPTPPKASTRLRFNERHACSCGKVRAPPTTQTATRGGERPGQSALEASEEGGGSAEGADAQSQRDIGECVVCGLACLRLAICRFFSTATVGTPPTCPTCVGPGRRGRCATGSAKGLVGVTHLGHDSRVVLSLPRSAPGLHLLRGDVLGTAPGISAF